MLSHSIFLGNDRSELQFISDLNSLCMRHKISCGQRQDLAHLGADLASNDHFRTDLFTLCTAISHMAEVDLTPEQLLVLVVRALGGPGISIRDVTVDLPEDASSTFLDGYEKWSKRVPDPDPPQPRRTDREQTPVSSQPGPTLYYSAVSRSRSDSPETPDDSRTIHVANRAPSHRSIPVNTPLEDLTLNELRMYLEDIENRVNRIEPRLERIAPRKHLSDEHFEQLEALDAQRENEAMAAAAAHHPEPALVPEPVVAAPQTEPALADTASATLIIPHHDAIVVETPPLERRPNSTIAAAHVHRLRIVNAILTSLLILVCGSAAVFAYRYLYLQPTSSTDAVNPLPAPLPDLTTKPIPAAETTPATHPNAAPSAASSIFAPVHRPNDATEGKVPYTNLPEASSLPAIHASVADPPPLAETKIPALSTTLPYETPLSPPLSQRAITAPAPENHPQPAAPLVASATPPSPRPANTPTPAPITQPALPANAIVAVPSSMMMAYAVSAPKPSYPSFRHGPLDSTVDVQTTISKEGKVISARALNGAIDVRGAAIHAVQTWRFKPFILDGTPVAVVTTFKFVFKGR